MEIQVVRGDITQMPVEAIVNAANSSLLGGGGVDGAIHREAGIGLLEECREIIQSQGECSAGNAVLTKAYDLPCKYVIHAVGPVWGGGNAHEDELLESAYRRAVEIAHEYKIASVAFPNISTGVYGFPKKRAAEIVSRYFKSIGDSEKSVKKIFFVCFDEENYTLYEDLFKN